MVVARAIPTPALIMLRNAYSPNAITPQSIKLRFQLMSAQPIEKCTLRAKFELGIAPMDTYSNPSLNGANRPHFL